MERGDIFDKGSDEYIEYIEARNEKEDLVVLYTREQEKPYRELKVVSSAPKGYLEEKFQKNRTKRKEKTSGCMDRGGPDYS